jgi:DNA modification methylase
MQDKLPEPIYNEDGITLYCADCTRVLPLLEPMSAELVLTDPPYPDVYADLFGYYNGILEPLRNIERRQIIFWSAKEDFPLDKTAIHIWDKQVECKSQYERIFERNGEKEYKIFRCHPIDSSVAAQMLQDKYYDHPTQKPVKLMMKLVNRFSETNQTILDPFAGSGTTLVAAKRLGRKAIGIEISEKYCRIAIDRLRQRELF